MPRATWPEWRPASGWIGPSTPRSMDEIHLASASQIRRELTSLITYDRRLLEGCRDVGLAAESPGTKSNDTGN